MAHLITSALLLKLFKLGVPAKAPPIAFNIMIYF